MSTAAQRFAARTAVPRVLRYCRCCDRETPHEIRNADGMSIAVCVGCVERALMYELGRD